MKTRKGFLQKMIITIAIALLCTNFIAPTIAQADMGGVLFDPISDLLCSIGDAVINVLQKCMTGDFGKGFSLHGGFLESDDEYDWATNGGVTYTGDNNVATEKIDVENEFTKGWLGDRDRYYVPVTTFSPEQIFANNVAGLDVNFINPNKYTSSKQSVAADLQPTIAGWYVSLRNLAVVGLLSVLVYVGIRILLASTAGDKAKYKEMLKDWVIALCLLFFMHYIMSFTLTMVESVTSAIAGDGETTVTIDVGGGKTFKTNLLGSARFKTQYKDFGDKVAYTIMYIALVIYTCIFTFFYLRRLLTLAFLTMIAPLVALTYPIDKLGDGKAQAFNLWLKEYIFNLLIQPFHLVIYMVLVGSAMQFASSNIIYMIAALAFILPAEKLLKRFFGIDKAGTLGDIVGATALGNMLGKGAKALGGGKGGNKGKSSDGGSSEANKPVRFNKGHGVDEIEGGEDFNGGSDIGVDNSNNQNLDDDNKPINPFPDDEMADYYNGNDDGTDDIDARMKEIEENEFNPEYNPEYQELQRRKQEEEARKNQEQNQEENIDQGSEAQRRAEEEQEKEAEELSRRDKFRNWRRANNITLAGMGNGALNLGKKTIGGAAKFATKTAFKAGAGALAGAIAIASGGGAAGGAAAFMAGASVGGKIGNKAVDIGSVAATGVGRAIKAGAYGTLASRADYLAMNTTGEKHDHYASKHAEFRGKAKDALLNGSMLGRELDKANGNSKYQEAGAREAFRKDPANIQYLKDQIAAQNNGVIPSDAKVQETMDSFDPYLAEGLTDIKEMLRAQKAEQFGISQKQSAIIAAIGKEKKIDADVLNDEKKTAARQANLAQEFRNKGATEKEANNKAAYTINVLKAQNGVAHNLKKPEEQPKQQSEPRQANQNTGNTGKGRGKNKK